MTIEQAWESAREVWGFPDTTDARMTFCVGARHMLNRLAALPQEEVPYAVENAERQIQAFALATVEGAS